MPVTTDYLGDIFLAAEVVVLHLLMLLSHYYRRLIGAKLSLTQSHLAQNSNQSQLPLL